MKLKEIKPGMVIHCKTEEEAEILFEQFRNQGIRWVFGISMEQTNWVKYKENTCYSVYQNNQLQFAEKEYWESLDLEITEFSDLIIPELSPAEVLKICNKICKEHENGDCASACKMYPNCFFEMKSDFQKVVEVCEQWKTDHERKEPEFEWVWQGRIYEIKDHDKGNFYQLKDGNGFYDTGCVNEESAEEYMAEVLKEYCEDHKGEFIAVVTHVCRVKQ